MIDKVFPVTKTVSTRLTRQDYRTFRRACGAMGVTMHRVVRLLIAAWIVDTCEQLHIPCAASERLARAVEVDRARKDGGFLPHRWA